MGKPLSETESGAGPGAPDEVDRHELLSSVMASAQVAEPATWRGPSRRGLPWSAAPASAAVSATEGTP